MTLAAAALLSARDYAIASNADLQARAAAEGFEVFFPMPEDEAYWLEQETECGIVTGADVIRRDAIQCYSDTYKAVYGIRPRWINFEGLSTERIGEMLSDIQAEADADEDETDWDAIAEADADEDFSLTEREAEEDLYRALPVHLIQAWGL